jgi:hypothetical protein
LLENCLLRYKPDLVILNLNSTDMTDTYKRGGNERYDTEGNYHVVKGPWWEFFFASSYIVRAITLHALHYSWNLTTPGEQKLIDAKVIKQISAKVSEYLALAQKKRFTLLLVLQPLSGELNNSSFISELNIAKGVRKIDLTPAFTDSVKNANGNTTAFYWPMDGHFNSRGYHAEAAIIYHDYFLSQNLDSAKADAK